MKKLNLLLLLLFSMYMQSTGQCSTTTAVTVTGTTANITATTIGGTPPYTTVYLLYPSNVVSNTGTFTGLSTGIYIITTAVFDANSQSCANNVYDTINIGNVNCDTWISAVSSTDTITATANTINGMPPYTYYFTLNPGNITNSTGLFTGLANGVYTVCANSVDANNQICNQQCDTITISGLPACNTNVSLSSSLDTITASAMATGGAPPYTYSYTLNPGNITNTTGIFTGLGNNLYTVCATATDSNNQVCSQACDTITVYTPPPCITQVNVSSSGTTITATATASGSTAPYTYSYNLNPGNVTNTTGIFTGLANGTYTVCATATDSNLATCSTDCGNASISSNPSNCIVNPAFSESINGYTVNFMNNTTISNGSITSYAWNFGNGAGSTAVSPIHNYTAAGMYNVVLVVTGVDAQQVQCIDSITKTINISGPNATNDFNTQALKIYPNPTSHDIVVAYPQKEKLEHLMLTDISGKKIQLDYKELQSGKLSVPLRNLGKGIYFIKLKTNKNNYTAHVLKQ